MQPNTQNPTRTDTKPVPYWQVGELLADAIRSLWQEQVDEGALAETAESIRMVLDACIPIRELAWLTALYRDCPARNRFGYDARKVCQFVGLMLLFYPRPNEE